MCGREAGKDVTEKCNQENKKERKKTEEKKRSRRTVRMR